MLAMLKSGYRNCYREPRKWRPATPTSTMIPVVHGNPVICQRATTTAKVPMLLLVPLAEYFLGRPQELTGVFPKRDLRHSTAKAASGGVQTETTCPRSSDSCPKSGGALYPRRFGPMTKLGTHKRRRRSCLSSS